MGRAQQGVQLLLLLVRAPLSPFSRYKELWAKHEASRYKAAGDWDKRCNKHIRSSQPHLDLCHRQRSIQHHQSLDIFHQQLEPLREPQPKCWTACPHNQRDEHGWQYVLVGSDSLPTVGEHVDLAGEPHSNY